VTATTVWAEGKISASKKKKKIMVFFPKLPQVFYISVTTGILFVLILN
jgi:hypothetical protein